MAETPQTAFNIQRIYMKDASLEIPLAPAVFAQTDAPTVEVQIDVLGTTAMGEVYEVVITSTVTTRIKNQVAFLVEVKQGGIFEIRGVPSEQLELLLGIVCPNIIFPYLRSNVADIISRAGFPPIHLAEINFEAFYHQRKAALAQQAKSNSSGASLVGPNGLPVQ